MTAPESLMKSVMNRRFTFEGRVAVPEAKGRYAFISKRPPIVRMRKIVLCGGRCYTRHQRCGSLREDEQMPLIAVHRAAASGLFNSALEDSACIKGNLQNTN